MSARFSIFNTFCILYIMWRLVTLFLILVLVAGCVSTEQSLSVSSVLNNTEKYLDKEISVTGKASVYGLRCTKVFCSEDNPCCNDCGGSLALEESGKKLPIDGVSCKGNECEQDCGSFEIGKEYTITGFLKQEEGEFSLKYEK